ASGVIKSLIDGFHAAYRVPRDRGILRQQIVAMALVLACALPLLIASLLILFGGLLERAIVNWMNVDPLLSTWSSAWIWVSLMTRYIVAFTTTAMVAAVLYYFG